MTTTHFCASSWHSPDNFNLSPSLTHWLLDTGSLTAKLKQHCRHFAVNILQHNRSPLSRAETAVLPPHQRNQVREVLLVADGVPVVFARSIIPDTANSLGGLNSIGGQPLGEVLFSRPDIVTGPISVSHFDQHSSLGDLNFNLHGTRQDLWGRRRTFTLEQNVLLVAEVFLSAAPCYK